MTSDVGTGCGRPELLPHGSGEEEEPLLVLWFQNGLKDLYFFLFVEKKKTSFQIQKHYILIKARQTWGNKDTDNTTITCNPSAF